MNHFAKCSVFVGAALVLAGAAGTVSAAARDTTYMCQNNLQPTVRYTMDRSGRPVSAQIPLLDRRGYLQRRITLRVAPRAPNADTSYTFRNGGYTLVVDKDRRGQVARSGGMQVTRSGYSIVNGRRMPVDQLIYKSCVVQ